MSKKNVYLVFAEFLFGNRPKKKRNLTTKLIIIYFAAKQNVVYEPKQQKTSKKCVRSLLSPSVV